MAEKKTVGDKFAEGFGTGVKQSLSFITILSMIVIFAVALLIGYAAAGLIGSLIVAIICFGVRLYVKKIKKK